MRWLCFLTIFLVAGQAPCSMTELMGVSTNPGGVTAGVVAMMASNPMCGGCLMKCASAADSTSCAMGCTTAASVGLPMSSGAVAAHPTPAAAHPVGSAHMYGLGNLHAITIRSRSTQCCAREGTDVSVC
jgi:hypothetical protein